MTISRRGALAGLAALSVGQARAQTAFPSKPMTLVVPFPAGGPSDVFGRLLAQGMAARIGPTVCELDGPMPMLKRSKMLTVT
jgi:tripartite-type tricarboxylate transporter receptor subunit TctC